MGPETVTGYCYLDEEMAERRKAGYIYLVFLFLLSVVLTIIFGPGMLISLFFVIVFAVCLFLHRRFGHDREATFELSEAGIKTRSPSPKMCRFFSWDEVSLIQITIIEPARATPACDCYVFVRGRENALIKCQAMETLGYIFSNPNRIAITINERTQPFVTAIAEKYGIPMERSYLG